MKNTKEEEMAKAFVEATEGDNQSNNVNPIVSNKVPKPNGIPQEYIERGQYLGYKSVNIEGGNCRGNQTLVHS